MTLSPDLLDRGTLIDEFSDKETNEVFGIVMRALTRLARITTELAAQDLSWLAEFIDQEEEKRKKH